MNSAPNSKYDTQLLRDTQAIVDYIKEVQESTGEISIKAPFQLTLNPDERKQILLMIDKELVRCEKRLSEIENQDWSKESDIEETRIKQTIGILTHIGKEVGHDENSFIYAQDFESEICKQLISGWKRKDRMRVDKENMKTEQPRKEAELKKRQEEGLAELEKWSDASQGTIDIADFENDLLDFFKLRGTRFSELSSWRVNIWKLFAKIMKRPDFESEVLPKLIGKDAKINHVLGSLCKINNYFDIDKFKEIFGATLPLFLAQKLYSEIRECKEFGEKELLDKKIWDMLEPFKNELVIDMGEGIYPRYILPTMFWRE